MDDLAQMRDSEFRHDSSAFGKIGQSLDLGDNLPE